MTLFYLHYFNGTEPLVGTVCTTEPAARGAAARLSGLARKPATVRSGQGGQMHREVASPPSANSPVFAPSQPMVRDQPMSLRALAQYAHLSIRMLRKALKDPVHPLPYYRVGRKYLVRRSD